MTTYEQLDLFECMEEAQMHYDLAQSSEEESEPLVGDAEPESIHYWQSLCFELASYLYDLASIHKERSVMAFAKSAKNSALKELRGELY